ncbi:MAG: asparagine synthetase B, partial [Bacteroidales bacterium]|nr:asparagine synthetase B [Candidatus Scybalousia scybalohippi]
LYAWSSFAAYALVPMDDAQKNHLKAYGIAYRNLEMGEDVNWLLNYRGGSFAMEENAEIVKLCKLRGVTYELISNSQMSVIVDEISDAEVNMDVVKLQKAPKIAVYSPKSKRPWDDAVTLVLSYAEIPYDVIYDEEVLNGVLPTYDWLHLHHEDFTGQYGKFWANYRTASWYKEDVAFQESLAKQLGFSKVSMLKLAVVKKIRDFVLGGGFMFAMCSATDSFDIALAAEGVDICESMFDGDAMDPQAQKKLNYENCFAFKDFHIETNPMQYRISDIDDSQERNTMVKESNDVFVLFDFSAKWDWIPTMLTQNHTRVIKGFFGQTSGFKRQFIKSNVLIMGENKSINEVRYIHGEYGKGTWSFLSGHDPEDYRHFVGDPKTDLSLFPTSPGFRLILNNILFPAAKKEKHKT